MMHKSYQPILPTSNRILQKKWDEKYYGDHKTLVKIQFGSLQVLSVFLGAQCSTQCGHASTEDLYASAYEIEEISSRCLGNLMMNQSIVQLEEERSATIERDNRILLEKMCQIMKTTGSVDNRNTYEPKRQKNSSKIHPISFLVVLIRKNVERNYYVYRKTMPRQPNESSSLNLKAIARISNAVGRKTAPISIISHDMKKIGMHPNQLVDKELTANFSRRNVRIVMDQKKRNPPNDDHHNIKLNLFFVLSSKSLHVVFLFPKINSRKIWDS